MAGQSRYLDLSAELDLRKLRYFLAVAHHLNFGRAAAELLLAQPALSRPIQSLEADLGVALFEGQKAAEMAWMRIELRNSVSSRRRQQRWGTQTSRIRGGITAFGSSGGVVTDEPAGGEGVEPQRGGDLVTATSPDHPPLPVELQVRHVQQDLHPDSTRRFRDRGLSGLTRSDAG
jgi:hypothetical protein